MLSLKSRFSAVARRAALLAASCISVACLAAPIARAADPAPAPAPAVAAPASAQQPMRIVCIGDSITQGRKGDGSQNKMVQSYRYPLWKMFLDAEIPVDFVGTVNEGFDKGKFGGDPDYPDYKGKAFDRDNEGHWGWTTQAVADKLPEWIQGYTPDIALTLLCTNDKMDKEKPNVEPTIAAHKSLIATLRAKNPKVVILIGKPYEEWAPFPAVCTAMDALAKELSTPDSPVVTVEHAKDWVSKPEDPNTCTVDWVHPNEKGDAKLAKEWFDALQPFLRKAAK
jgi:lysophospholipase L1-like esterase